MAKRVLSLKMSNKYVLIVYNLLILGNRAVGWSYLIIILAHVMYNACWKWQNMIYMRFYFYFISIQFKVQDIFA